MSAYMGVFISFFAGFAANIPSFPNEITANISSASVSRDILVAEPVKVIEIIEEPKKALVPEVPFYSQFEDIRAKEWKKVSCGIADLAMLIEYYNPGIVEPNKLLKEGIDSGAYLNSAGWTYAGLIKLSNKYGLDGESYLLGNLKMSDAFQELKAELENGPVMASVYYTFDPKSPIPHLVVINGIVGDEVYYNDPAEKSGGGKISIDKFKAGWKKRYIVFRPVSEV